MTQFSPQRSRPFATYAAIALFVAVYLGGLALVLVPKTTFGVQTGAEFVAND